MSAAGRRLRLSPPFGRLLSAWIALALVLGLVIAAFGSLTYRDWTPEAHFFWTEDLPVLVACLGLTLALAFAPRRWLAAVRTRIAVPPRTGVWLLAAACLVAGAAGVTLVFNDYVFSLDEFLANFDAQIFAAGHLIAHVPPQWQDYSSAMQPMYMLPLPDDVWASSYLPVNAGLRALGRVVHLERFVNPALSAFSIVAVWAVGRRIWPERPSIGPVAAALLGTSSQLLVTAMSAYAMPAHLAFNLAWLWLFLRGGKAGHAGAIAVGFLATGIHQLLFHPVFVAPFVLQLWFKRRWGLAGLYTLAYAAICGFWVEYWPLAMQLNRVAPDVGQSTGGGFFFDRVTDAFKAFHLRNFGVQAECLLRFVTWQNPLTAPLALIGAVWAVWTRGYLRPLGLGVLLTLIAVFVATPTQTHGWGYRYLHGLLGSVALIAAWAWTRLTGGLPAPARTAAAGALAVACLVSLLVLTPVRAWQAWSFVHPYAAANAAVQNAKADVVIIDHDSNVLFDKNTLTRNDPFLNHTPKVMALSDMDGDMVSELCASHLRVLIFNGEDAARYGIEVTPWRGPSGLAQLRAMIARQNCAQPMPR